MTMQLDKIEDVLSKKGIILFPFNHMKGMN